MNASEFDDKRRRALFSARAAEYGDGRPGYPPEVFTHLEAACGLGPACRVLEVGPGAGQATGPLLDAGARVIAVETGKEFGRLLRARYRDGRLDVRIGDFETIELPTDLDLVVAATSFHWISPQAGLVRVADALKLGGSLALWWNHYGDPDRPDPFREAIQSVLLQHAPQFADRVGQGAGIGAHPYALDEDSRVGEIDSSKRFGPVDCVRFPWTATQTASEVRSFLASFSHWMALDEQIANALLSDVERLVEETFGGSVERPFLTAVYTTKRCS